MQWHRDLRVRERLPADIGFRLIGCTGLIRADDLGVGVLLLMGCLCVNLHAVDVCVVRGLDPFLSLLPNSVLDVPL